MSVIQTESRVKKTLLNARVNLIFYFLQLFLAFFSRKIFLDCLGDDFIGLTGTLQNLLGFLNLAELGIGSAIGYLLYKPLYDHNQEKITEIISVMGYLYRWIGLIILGGGIILSGFLPLIFPLDRANGPEPATPFAPHINYGIIYFAYYAFLASSLIGYFINYRQNLLGADQRNYVVTAYFQTANIIKVLIQMAIAYLTLNLFLWVTIELVFGILYSIILNWKINQTYPWLKAKVHLGKSLFKKYPDVMKRTKQIFFHRMNGFAHYQVLPFLVYTFSSLNLVAYYQNYTLITSRVSGFFSNILSGMGASIGNLIAEGNKTKILSVFWELQSIKLYIAGIVCIPTYFLIDPFINIWLGQEYLLSKFTLILILIPILIQSIRGILDDFIWAYGLTWDIWTPICEFILLIISSTILGIFYKMNGVLCGPIISLGLLIFWKSYLLFHWGIKDKVFLYWLELLKNLLCLSIGFIIIKIIVQFNQEIKLHNFIEWIIYGIIIFLIYFISTYFIFIFATKGMKILNKRVILLIKSYFLKLFRK